MTDDILEKEKKNLTPENGFNLIGKDYFSDSDNKLYLIENFEKYQDALKARKERKNSDEYYILYKGASGEYLCR